MHSYQKCSIRRGVVPLENQAWVNEHHSVSPTSAFGGISPFAPKMPRPVHDIEYQPFEICHQNFIIVDEMENQNRIMFHPGIAQNLRYPHMDIHETPKREITEENYGSKLEEGTASPLIEDSDYIDLLLGLDEDQGESEEEVSTARSQGYDGSSSPESCCNYASKSRKTTNPCSFKRESTSCSSHCENKRKEARKMLRALRGMVPGGEQMNTAAVFDATVRQLKGLEGKVQKLGLSNLKHFP